MGLLLRRIGMFLKGGQFFILKIYGQFVLPFLPNEMVEVAEFFIYNDNNVQKEITSADKACVSPRFFIYDGGFGYCRLQHRAKRYIIRLGYKRDSAWSAFVTQIFYFFVPCAGEHKYAQPQPVGYYAYGKDRLQ